KLGSGCNLLGYYMYRGGTTPTGRRTPYLNEGQIPKRSYDYQAALGEFGQVRESYGRLRAIHLLCRTFSGFLEQTKAVLPEHLRALRPEALDPLRFAVRVKDSSGFLFVNNFQDHAPMRDRAGDEVALALPDGELRFRFDIAAGENAILPFGIDLGGARLDWATAQPLARVGDTWFFFAPEGMKPRYCVDGEVIEARVGEAFARGGIAIHTMSRKDSLGFAVYDGRAWLCDKPLLWDGEGLFVELEAGGADVFAWSDAERRFALYARVESRNDPAPAAFRAVGLGRYTVEPPESGLTGHKQVLLRVDYRGDIGHAFIGGELISDNFSNGAPWDIRVDDRAEALKDDPLVIYITPAKEGVVVDASAMAGLRERAGSLTAELISARWVAVDDVPIA
ncbi:MAG: beta-galactosidase, partial [Clostridia bacterium]|nr:beta-galactosidase [Clostridia bacterium]